MDEDFGALLRAGENKFRREESELSPQDICMSPQAICKGFAKSAGGIMGRREK